MRKPAMMHSQGDIKATDLLHEPGHLPTPAVFGSQAEKNTETP